MARRKAASSAKKRGTGKPFKKGHDPRRNKNGSKSKAVVAFNKTLRELLVAEGEQIQKGTIGETTIKLKKVEWLVKSIWKKAIEGESWAVNFIAERVEGKVEQPVGITGKVKLSMTYLKKSLKDYKENAD